MSWGAQTRKSNPPRQSATWGAQTKPGRGEIRKRGEDGEVWSGSRRYNWLGKEKG
jgi:hypothetical protein